MSLENPVQPSPEKHPEPPLENQEVSQGLLRKHFEHMMKAREERIGRWEEYAHSYLDGPVEKAVEWLKKKGLLSNESGFKAEDVSYFESPEE